MPLHPYLVMAVAIVLPGVGQLLNNQQQRALVFLFFMILLGMVTMHTASPDASFIGRYAGGLAIYSLSVLDAYRWARLRWEIARKEQRDRAPDASAQTAA
ncbi:hypothetical protein A7A08_01538 [Methyloligella halotolerans]|uniref:Uncharacterized protein n=2 Tax=Methyloligella halotolerans TaxID=1177755 RepID=A0A1E2RZH1_9HYPH|nr:hypothetical protein A7A08_01538 [Methyloligella halotolerans]